MNAVVAIARRELTTYFNSFTAYIVICLFLLIAGGLFWMGFFNVATTELSMRQFFGQAPFFLAFFAPAISMGLLSEEQRARTLELMMTLPVTDMQVVLGKFAAALSLLAIVLASTLPYALSLATLGDLDWGPVIGGYVGLLLLGSAYLAIGVMVSSWTKDQIVSILVAFFLCFTLNIIGDLARFLDGTMAASVLRFLSTSSHFENIARGVIDTRDVLYYLSVAVVALTAAATTLSRRRW